MPTSIRPKGKAQRIADDILGVPSNLSKRSRRSTRVSESDIKKRLIHEETRFVR